ncbi:hypothetical protein [Paraburkholderia phosphatilytica]|nr:hypothetical protein [Paraburkholderia phosphatilytica]
MTQHTTQPLQQHASQPRQDTHASTRSVIASARTIAFALLADRALAA